MSAGGAQTTWVDGAWDLLNGCRPVSSGCAHCPACASLARRGYSTGVVWRNTVAEWEKPFRSGSLILLCSTSDPFIEDGEIWWEEIASRLRGRPDVTFIALTKRLEQAQKFVARFGVLSNLWLGTSAEDQATLAARLPVLYAIPAAGYVISLQPLLCEIDLEPYLYNGRLRKVVAGCELGPKARPCKKAWLDQIARQCRKHGVRCFITRYKDEHGRACTSPTENGRGSHHSRRRSYNTKRPPTIGSRQTV